MTEGTDNIALADTDLDRLAERVERTAALVQRLREENLNLTRERDALVLRVSETESKLMGQDVAALLAELQGLRKDQREWQSQRRDVASRIESLVKKLERLEG
jgi:chromosome segregation ATPase